MFFFWRGAVGGAHNVTVFYEQSKVSYFIVALERKLSYWRDVRYCGNMSVPTDKTKTILKGRIKVWKQMIVGFFCFCFFGLWKDNRHWNKKVGFLLVFFMLVSNKWDIYLENQFILQNPDTSSLLILTSLCFFLMDCVWLIKIKWNAINMTHVLNMMSTWLLSFKTSGTGWLQWVIKVGDRN